MPAILEDAVKSIMKENPDMKKGAAYAIATKQLQKSGDLKRGGKLETPVDLKPHTCFKIYTK